MLTLGKYLGDIVMGDIGDIDQPQCHTCTKKQKYCERERRQTLVTMWLANVTMSPTTMSPKFSDGDESGIQRWCIWVLGIQWNWVIVDEEREW